MVTTLLAGVLLTTVISGRLITRTGRYKPYRVVGTALAALGLALLAPPAAAPKIPPQVPLSRDGRARAHPYCRASSDEDARGEAPWADAGHGGG